ncbi:unnamed protein product [Rodentolepis nana]|uniref:U4/U6.U5 tri-snRNP-associated protein 1 n=1 Tax=Rodentolepis nana TaxID=102285 RepID=A0A0R3T225_RODNA|nr:unnamed protein product [Rodentolepis nana]
MHRREKRDDESKKHRKRPRSRSKDKSPHKESRKSRDKKRRVVEEEGMFANYSINDNVEEVRDQGAADKLRAKLGLAPLEVGNESKTDGGDDERPKNSDSDFVHAPAKDLTKAKQAEKIQEKIATAKEKRELLNKLREVKSLGSGEETSVSSWVEKMRAKEQAKKEAEKREKMLAELDEEFGVSTVVEEQLKPRKPREAYTSDALQGLKVEHSIDRFSEGTPIILTLKDSDVLAEDPTDVLTNVNLVDEEKAEKNRENKRKLAGLGGILQDDEEDVLMGLREKGILEKYDAEIDGPRKAEFTLEANGSYVTDHERALKQLQEELQRNRQALGDTEYRPAAEFYTSEEMGQFKKKKKRKVHRRILRPDDLIPDAGAPSTTAGVLDHGSRSSDRHGAGIGAARAVAVEEEGEVIDKKSSDEDVKPHSDLSALTGLNPAIAAILAVQTVPQEDDEGDDEDAYADLIAEPLEPDDLQLELERTLSRVRNSNLAKPVPVPEERLKLIVKEDPDTEMVEARVSEAGGGGGGGLVFDATAEFFKQISSGLQNDVTAKMVKQEAEEEVDGGEEIPSLNRREKEDDVDRSSDRRAKHRDSVSSRYSTKHSSSSSRRRHDDKSSINKFSSGRSNSRVTEEPSVSGSYAPTAEASGNGVFEEEPTLNQGVFSALLLAQKKGYVEEQKEKERPMGQLVNLMAKHYVKEDMRYDDIDAKFAKRERHTGPLSDFREKTSYKPDVKLYYVDEMGHNLTPKEAFRQLSHKFHGKGSGKKKTEKRNKKFIEEALIKNSAGSDTPLGTLNKLNKKLEQQATPYVVLSGKGSVS